MKKVILLYAVLIVAFILLAVIGFGRDIPFVPDFGFGNNSNQDNNQNTPDTTAATTINGEEIELIVAKSGESRALGLSGRDSLADNQGMIFVFDEKGIYPFWMKGMNFPIDIIFINDNTVTDVYENLPPAGEDSNPMRYSPSEPVNYTLELNAGRASELGIERGTTITFEGL